MLDAQPTSMPKPPFAPFSQTSAHTGKEKLKDALDGAEVVVIPAGFPRKPGMTRDDLFDVNAQIVRELVEACAQAAPGAMLCVITNPVNSTVPIAAQVLKRARVFDPRRLFGVTLLDVVRAETFYARELGLLPGQVSVPVVGGHAGTTILPLFSQAVPPPPSSLSADDLRELTRHTQDAGTEVVEAKQGKGSATLSMAYAAERFCDALLRAMAGEPGVEICAYVASDARKGLEFFASKVLLGENGVEKILPLGQLSEIEEKQLQKAESDLKTNIDAGLNVKLG
ncbi:alpha/beta C-terminal domain of lactate/malate dehydrogenase [Helicosporidium sp. ATCC 50920]|nr:alpha/beta C-terminal domain of lactate/malate dehydrogenase [Helicosporidium sp. ATCC 50920]|eukprot:KDD77075.1 alpha/beta C-terminal domain of lactate/malate dehydrogenase [Helicosporidium sp. ATCC 50920]